MLSTTAGGGVVDVAGKANRILVRFQADQEASEISRVL